MAIKTLVEGIIESHARALDAEREARRTADAAMSAAVAAGFNPEGIRRYAQYREQDEARRAAKAAIAGKEHLHRQQKLEHAVAHDMMHSGTLAVFALRLAAEEAKRVKRSAHLASLWGVEVQDANADEEYRLYCQALGIDDLFI